MRCQRCGFEISEGTVDCQQCDKRQVVKNSGLPASVSYFICFVGNALGLIIALLIFSAISDQFEVIVIALLTIIYLTVKGAAGMNTLSLAEFAKLTYRKISANESRGNQRDHDWDHMDDPNYVADLHTRAKVKMYINGGFDAALYVVALFNLVVALYQ
jgi:hypothetical protein